MNFTRTGIILVTENYTECVRFYQETLGLGLLFALDNEHSRLTSLDMGGGNYLMIETGGHGVTGAKDYRQNPVWIRFNVQDVESASAALQAKGIDVNIRREPWGTVADFTDPDGNVCSFRDEASFGQ